MSARAFLIAHLVLIALNLASTATCLYLFVQIETARRAR